MLYPTDDLQQLGVSFIEYYTNAPRFGALPFALAPRGLRALFMWGPGYCSWAHVYCLSGATYYSSGARVLFKWGPRTIQVGPAYKIYLIIFI